MAAEILHGGCTPDAVQRLATAVETLRWEGSHAVT